MGTIYYNAQPSATNAALYTNSTSAAVTISQIVAVNATGSAVTLTLTLVRHISGTVEATTGGGVVIPAASASALVYDVNLALEELVLDPGDALWGQASTASAVTVIAFQ
jgi:hypothetical protein